MLTTCLNSAEEPPDPKQDTNGNTFPGQIAQMTAISAVNPPRSLPHVGQQLSSLADRNTITTRLCPTASNSCRTTSVASGTNVLCPIGYTGKPPELTLLFPRSNHPGSIIKCAEEPTECCHLRNSQSTTILPPDATGSCHLVQPNFPLESKSGGPAESGRHTRRGTPRDSYHTTLYVLPLLSTAAPRCPSGSNATWRTVP